MDRLRQKWHKGKIIEERYFDGDLMNDQIAAGILLQPENLL